MFPTDNSNIQTALGKIPETLNKASSGIILLPINPTMDAIAAATALSLGLAKINKNVTVACATPIRADLVGADKIQSNLSTGGDNLVISFPYHEGALDKVDYGVQGDSFNIIITPRPGQTKLEPNKVHYSYTGGNMDFIFTIDAPNLHSLGKLYSENENDFNGKTIINVDRHLVNDLYGAVNYVNKTASSTSELVMNVLESLEVEVDKDIATNLYAGLSVATNNFTSYSVNADTFEVAAKLLKRGALKKPPIRTPITGVNNNQGNTSMYPGANSQVSFRQPQMNSQMPAHNPNSFAFPPSSSMKELPPIEDIEQEAGMSDDDGDGDGQTPEDWLKPKIFKGGGLI